VHSFKPIFKGIVLAGLKLVSTLLELPNILCDVCLLCYYNVDGLFYSPKYLHPETVEIVSTQKLNEPSPSSWKFIMVEKSLCILICKSWTLLSICHCLKLCNKQWNSWFRLDPLFLNQHPPTFPIIYLYIYIYIYICTKSSFYSCLSYNDSNFHFLAVVLQLFKTVLIFLSYW